MACQRVAWPGSSQMVQVRKQKLQRGLSHRTCVVRPSSGRENETCVFLLMSWVQNKKPASADAAPENRIFEKLRPFKSQIFCAHAKRRIVAACTDALLSPLVMNTRNLNLSRGEGFGNS